MKLEERLKVLGEKWANLPECKEANEIADECMEELPQLLSKIEQLEKACAEMRESLGAILRLIDNGVLVRYTANDLNPDWAMGALPLVQALQAANRALSTSCGSSYIHWDELKPLVENLMGALKSIAHDNLCSCIKPIELCTCTQQFAANVLAKAENLMKGETK